MALSLFVLHAKQFGRLLKEVGLFRSLVLLALLTFVLVRAYTIEPPLTYGLAALLVSLLSSLHAFRKDKVFLRVLGLQEYLLYAVQYHLLVSPFYAIFLLNRRWWSLMAVVIGVCLVPLLTPSFQHQVGTVRPLAFVPPEAFEWKSGLRRYGIIIGLLYLIALVGYPYPFVALAVIIVFTLLATTFYNESEPRPMVDVFVGSPTAFLIAKWRIQLMLFWTGCLPLLLIFLWALPEYWYVALVLGVVSSIIQVLSINLKYSLYEPGLSLNKGIFMFIYFLSLFVPYFVPVPLAMALYYYRRANQNLQTYLDDSY